MGMSKKLKGLVLVVAATSVLMGCGLVGKVDGEVYASIGKTKITEKMIDNILATQINSLVSQYGEDYEEKIDDETKEQLKDARQHVAETLAEAEIVKLKARELGLIGSDKELTKEAQKKVEEIKSRYPDEEAFKQALKANRYSDEESFVNIAKNQVVFEKVTEYLSKDLTVGDEEVKNYYEQHKETEFIKKAGADSRHILFKPEEETAAKELKAKIDAGTSFDELFKEYEGNKAKNQYPIAEDLSFVMYEQPDFDSAFLEGLKPLKEGEISEPVKSRFGYHIIEAKNVTSEDTIEPFEDVKESLTEWFKKNKANDLYDEKLTQWKDEVEIKYNEELLSHGIGEKH